MMLPWFESHPLRQLPRLWLGRRRLGWSSGFARLAYARRARQNRESHPLRARKACLLNKLLSRSNRIVDRLRSAARLLFLFVRRIRRLRQRMMGGRAGSGNLHRRGRVHARLVKLLCPPPPCAPRVACRRRGYRARRHRSPLASHARTTRSRKSIEYGAIATSAGEAHVSPLRADETIPSERSLSLRRGVGPPSIRSAKATAGPVTAEDWNRSIINRQISASGVAFESPFTGYRDGTRQRGSSRSFPACAVRFPAGRRY